MKTRNVLYLTLMIILGLLVFFLLPGCATVNPDITNTYDPYDPYGNFGHTNDPDDDSLGRIPPQVVIRF